MTCLVSHAPDEQNWNRIFTTFSLRDYVVTTHCRFFECFDSKIDPSNFRVELFQGLARLGCPSDSSISRAEHAKTGG